MISQNDAVITITDLETLKVISDPLRLNIIHIIKDVNLSGALCSVKQISEQLGVPPAKLYYHIKLLEKHGFLEVAETHIVSGIVEKLYRLRSFQIMVSNDLFLLEDGGESIAAVCANLFSTTLNEIQHILQKHKEETIEQYISVAKYSFKFSLSKAEEFRKELDDLVKKFSEVQIQNSNDIVHNFNFTFAAYPSEIKTSKTEV